MSCESNNNKASSAAKSSGGITGPSNRSAGVTGSTMYRLGKAAGTAAFLPANASLGMMKFGVRSSVKVAVGGIRAGAGTVVGLSKFGAGMVVASPGAKAVNSAIKAGANGVRVAQMIAADPKVRNTANRAAAAGKAAANATREGVATARRKIF